MREDAFSRCHPAVNFVFFLLAIGFGVVIQHPAYLAVGVLFSAAYTLVLLRRRAMRLIVGLIPLFLIMSAVNPLFNTRGNWVLFAVFSRPYNFEALCHGAATSAVFVVMILWFRCYSEVLTSDKFTALFGRIIPSLSLLLVMVLRMIPNLMKKARQILTARAGIGKGIRETASTKEKLQQGASALSALTDWALEGSIVTADSMRSRGYGSRKRSSFRLWKMKPRDWVLLIIQSILALAVILSGGTAAQYTPSIVIDPPSLGLFFYSLLLSIPLLLQGKEVLLWHYLRSKI